MVIFLSTFVPIRKARRQGNGFRFEVQNQELDPEKDEKLLLVSRLFLSLKIKEYLVIR